MDGVRLAIESDFSEIDALRKSEGASLGFIPKDVYLSVLGRRRVANRDRWKYQTIWVYTDNDEITGFVYAVFYRRDVKIEQIVVREDARRWARATALEGVVRAMAQTIGATGIRCRVACDLESNAYWKAMGYTPQRKIVSTWLNQRQSKSKRELFDYLYDFGTPLFGANDGCH